MSGLSVATALALHASGAHQVKKLEDNGLPSINPIFLLKSFL